MSQSSGFLDSQNHVRRRGFTHGGRSKGRGSRSGSLGAQGPRPDCRRRRNARKGYEQLLQRWGCEVLGVSNAEDALAKFATYQPDALIADVELPGMNGLDLLKQLGPELHDVPAIIITGKGSEERAVAAIEAGAFWYIEKPLKGPVLRALLDRALSRARDARQLVVLQRQLRESGRLGELVGASKPMQDVMRLVEMAAPSSASVLSPVKPAPEKKSSREPFTNFLLAQAARLSPSIVPRFLKR